MTTKLYYNTFIPAFSNTGIPFAESKLYFYYTGTLTLAPIYADSAGLVPLANPVQANLAGKYPNIYYDSSITYRVRQTDKNGAPIGDDVDPYSPVSIEAVNEAVASAAAAEAAAIVAQTAATSVSLKSAYSFVTDGVIFDTSRGDTFTSKWTVPTDATLTTTATDITFNSPSTPKTLRMKLKNLAGTGDYKGTFENDWETDFTATLLGSMSTAATPMFDAGFVIEDPRITLNWYGVRMQTHGGTAAQFLPAQYNQGSQIGLDSSGYTYTVGDTIRVRTRRSGTILTCIINYNGGADHTLTATLDLGNPPTDHELPRLLSTPMFYFLQGYYKITAAKVSITNPNAQAAIVGTSLSASKFASTYANGYSQKIKSAHATGLVMVCGGPSATSTDILGELPDILIHKPRTVVLEPFANDALTTTPLATTQANVASLVAACNAAGARPVFINCPPLSSTYATAINSWLATSGYTYVDIYTPLLGTGNNLSATYDCGDHIHWNDAGHTLVQGIVDTWLTNLGVYSTAGNTLLVDTDPTMAANSSGRTVTESAIVSYVGTRGNFVPSKPVTGDIFINAMHGSAEAASTVAYTNDRMDLALFHPANTFTTSTIEIDVQTAAAAGKRAKIVIYADNNGTPGALIASSGHLAVDTTGVKTWTVSQTFVRHTRYWVGIHSEDVVTVYAPALRHCRAIGYDKVNHNHTICWRKSSTYASGVPTSGAGGTAVSATPAMLIFTAA